MKKIALTSVITICVACPAFAEPSHTSATFPNDEYMLEDYTYTGQATNTNMGVYDGSVNANAEYDWDIITVNPGYYIPQSSTSAAQCTAGSFCPGIATDNQAQTPHYDSTAAQGITSCSTLESGAYPNSAVGASANTDCYRACTVANANIAHATAVSGNDYYGAGVDTCEPTACENGWSVKAGFNPATDLPAQNGNDFEFYTHEGTTVYNPDNDLSAGEWKVKWTSGTNQGTLKGIASCNSTQGDNDSYTWGNDSSNWSRPGNTFTNSANGESCWCKPTTWTPDGGTSVDLSAAWVFHGGMLNRPNCADACAEGCAEHMSSESALRSAMFGSIESSAAMCAANTITINWSDASAEDIATNNAGTATYGGDIRTPRAATPVTGKTFKGWKFQKPGQGGN